MTRWNPLTDVWTDWFGGWVAPSCQVCLCKSCLPSCRCCSMILLPQIQRALFLWPMHRCVANPSSFFSCSVSSVTTLPSIISRAHVPTNLNSSIISFYFPYWVIAEKVSSHYHVDSFLWGRCSSCICVFCFTVTLGGVCVIVDPLEGILQAVVNFLHDIWNIGKFGNRNTLEWYFR